MSGLAACPCEYDCQQPYGNLSAVRDRTLRKPHRFHGQATPHANLMIDALVLHVHSATIGREANCPCPDVRDRMAAKCIDGNALRRVWVEALTQVVVRDSRTEHGIGARSTGRRSERHAPLYLTNCRAHQWRNVACSQCDSCEDRVNAAFTLLSSSSTTLILRPPQSTGVVKRRPKPLPISKALAQTDASSPARRIRPVLHQPFLGAGQSPRGRATTAHPAIGEADSHAESSTHHAWRS